MQLVGEADGVKELDGVGADVDAGAELGELGRLLVDLHFEALPAERDGRRQSAEAGSDNGNAARFSHLCSGNWNHLGTLSIGFDPETTGGGRDLGTLQIDGRRELTGISGPDELAVRLQPRHDGGVAGNRLDIRRDPVAKLLAHVGQPEQSDKPVERQIRIAGFDGSRNVGRMGSALAVGYHDQPDLSDLDLRPDDGQRGQIDLDAPFGEIVERLNAISIRDLVDVQTRAVEESSETQIHRARDASPVELAGFGADQRHQFPQRTNFQRCWDTHAHERAGHTNDRHQLPRIVRQLLVEESDAR